MKRLHLFTILILALVAISCDKSELGNKGSLIYISATTEDSFGTKASTKVPYTYAGPSSSNESSHLDAIVLASTTANEYKNTGADGSDIYNGSIGMHLPSVFRGSSEQVLNGPIYSNQQQSLVYFSALSPNPAQNSWSISNDGKSASFVFNGTQDLMFAPQVSGSYALSNPTPPAEPQYPNLNFNHLLTLINLSIYAETEEVKNAWGNITNITIRNAHDMEDYSSNTATVNSDKPFSDPSAVVFTKAEPVIDMPFYYNGTNNLFPGTGNSYELAWKPTNAANFTAPKVAYVMLAPVKALANDLIDTSMEVPEFEIAITTSNRREPVIISVDLIKSATGSSTTYFTGSTAGLEFNFTLKFTMGNTVAVQAIVTNWKTGGYGVGDVTDTNNPVNNNSPN